MNANRANLRKICEIKVNNKNRLWVCTETVLVWIVPRIFCLLD